MEAIKEYEEILEKNIKTANDIGDEFIAQLLTHLLNVHKEKFGGKIENI